MRANQDRPIETLPDPAAGLRIPDDVLRSTIEGQGLRGPTLADHLGDRPTLLCFLRHFG